MLMRRITLLFAFAALMMAAPLTNAQPTEFNPGTLMRPDITSVTTNEPGSSAIEMTNEMMPITYTGTHYFRSQWIINSDEIDGSGFMVGMSFHYIQGTDHLSSNNPKFRIRLGHTLDDYYEDLEWIEDSLTTVFYGAATTDSDNDVLGFMFDIPWLHSVGNIVVDIETFTTGDIISGDGLEGRHYNNSARSQALSLVSIASPVAGTPESAPYLPTATLYFNSNMEQTLQGFSSCNTFNMGVDKFRWAVETEGVNGWRIGRDLRVAGINDGNEYNTHESSYSVAYSPFVTLGGEYAVNYDWRCGGEDGYDFMRVLLIPSDSGFPTASEITATSMPAGAIALDGQYALSGSTDWQHYSGSLRLQEGNYMLAVVWKNDDSQGSQPAAAIDDIRIMPVSNEMPFQADWENNQYRRLDAWHSEFWYDDESYDYGNILFPDGSDLKVMSTEGNGAYDNEVGSYSFFYRMVDLAAGSYDARFSWKCAGEGNEGNEVYYDYGAIVLVPESVGFAAENGGDVLDEEETIHISGGPLFQHPTWQTDTVNFTVPRSGHYYLMFCWFNDDSGGENPGVTFSDFTIVPHASSAGIDDAPALSVGITPNPATAGSEVTLSVGGLEGEATLELIDLNGRVVRTHHVAGQGSHTISLDGLAQGLYHARLTSAAGTAVHRLLVR